MCVLSVVVLSRLEVIECVAFSLWGDGEVASLVPQTPGGMEGCCFSYFPAVWTLLGHLNLSDAPQSASALISAKATFQLAGYGQHTPCTHTHT